MPDEARVDEFLRLHTRHEPRLHAFVLSLVPNWSDAEDVVQETVTVLWAKFDQFEPGSNYFAWACQVARYETQRFLRQNRRECVQLTDVIADMIAEATVELGDSLYDRERALGDCVDKLPEQDRALIEFRYRDNLTAGDISQRVGRSVHAVYKAMKRIRRVLYDCVTITVSEEGDT